MEEKSEMEDWGKINVKSSSKNVNGGLRINKAKWGKRDQSSKSEEIKIQIEFRAKMEDKDQIEIIGKQEFEGLKDDRGQMEKRAQKESLEIICHLRRLEVICNILRL